MFLQLQAYWQQPVAFSPKVAIGGEIFTCHDLDDLRAAQKFLAGKAEPLVYCLQRDGTDMCHRAVDLDELIAETEQEQHSDFQLHYRGLLRAALR